MEFDGEWFGVYDWHEPHLAVMVLAYHEAAGSDNFGQRFDRLERELPAMSTRYRPEGVVCEGDVVEVLDDDADVERYVVAPSSMQSVDHDVTVVSRQAPLGRELVGAHTGGTVSFKGPVGELTVVVRDIVARAQESSRARPHPPRIGVPMTRYSEGLTAAIREYNDAIHAGTCTSDPQQAVIMMALLRQNELLEELVGRTTPL